jgi:dipeptidyl aminopeptidase/acylaminoacyl peptidase
MTKSLALRTVLPRNRRIYFDSSPVSYATVGRNRARFLLIHGTADDQVDPTTQSQAFQNALNQAGVALTAN